MSTTQRRHRTIRLLVHVLLQHNLTPNFNNCARHARSQTTDITRTRVRHTRVPRSYARGLRTVLGISRFARVRVRVPIVQSYGMPTMIRFAKYVREWPYGVASHHRAKEIFFFFFCCFLAVPFPLSTPTTPNGMHSSGRARTDEGKSIKFKVNQSVTKFVRRLTHSLTHIEASNASAAFRAASTSSPAKCFSSPATRPSSVDNFSSWAA